MPPYKDVADLPEDERIRMIGEEVVNKKKVVSFVTDDDSGKMERYLEKLKKQFPTIRVIAYGIGSVPGTRWAKVGPGSGISPD